MLGMVFECEADLEKMMEDAMIVQSLFDIKQKNIIAWCASLSCEPEDGI